MDKLKNILRENLNKDFLSAVLSGSKDKERAEKVKARPVMKKGELKFQLEVFRGRQAFHENLSGEEAAEKLLSYMENFRQMQMETATDFYTILVSKKGKVTVKRRKQCREREKAQAGFAHNRKKRYILEEGKAVPFLVDLGVMTREGAVVHAKFDKFRQINRFLEFIEDILPELPGDREVTILDFGCGKSYLTFAMHYYLHDLKKYDVRIIGLDLKRDVIARCNELAEKYGCEKLNFSVGNIADYAGDGKVDMVVTLHACDTATDYALAKAVGWNVKVILSVPCCQHELNAQLGNRDAGKSRRADAMEPVLKYGLLRERMASLITDGLRAKYLEREGYDVQVLEFIDMEHTPKNILLRAVQKKSEAKSRRAEENIEACESFFQVSPMLGRLLGGAGRQD
jgi:SAM-dependent methyltransferase